MNKWQYFTMNEFECKCGCGENFMREDFINKLDALRNVLGFPLRVSSGYRCPSHNDRVSTTGLYGPHTTGRAVDFQIAGEKALRLIQVASNRSFTGVGINQKGDHSKRFVHLDDLGTGQRPWIWTY